jgi:hypothetical protein
MNNKMPALTSTNESYSTTDMNLAAYLLARGYRFIGTQPKGSWRRIFVFEAGAAGEVEGFYRDTATVTARSYAEAIRSMKCLLHDAR